MKKLLKLSLALTMVLFLSACSAVAAENKADYSDRTLTGKITSINGSSVTLQIGKLKQDDAAMGQMPQMGQFQANGEAPEMAEGEMPEFNGEAPAFGEGQMPETDGEVPELPSGDMTQGEAPQMNGMEPMMPGRGERRQMSETGQLPTDGQMPQMTEGEMPEMTDGQMPQFNGEAPAFGDGQMPQFPADGEMPEFNDEAPAFGQGQMPRMTEGQMPMMGSGQGMKGQMGGSYTFKEGKETVTIDLGDTAVSLSDGTTGSVSDLKVGDVVSIDVDKNNEVASVKVYSINTEE